jgi:tRNA(Ile)-lysidine synthase
VHTIIESLSNTIPPLVPVVVAFSGGADSLALLCAISSLRNPLIPVYVNHHIRPEAELEQELFLNRENCRRLSLDLVVRDVDAVALHKETEAYGVEQAARNLRYGILISEAKKRQAVLVTAHTADDQLETMVMRLCQGASVSSLSIAPKVTMDGVTVYHPLLSFSHNDLCAFLQKKGFVWSEDSTNGDDAYLRNRIRHRVIPRLKEVFPHVLSAALRTAGSSSEVADGIASIVGSLPVRPLSRDVFLACPPMARDEVVYHLLSSEKRVSYDGVRRIRESIEGERLYWYVRTNGKVVRSIDGVIGVEDDRPEGGFCVSVDHLNPGTRLELANGLLLLVEEDDPGLDPLSLRVPRALLAGAVLRSPLPGDELVAAGGVVKVRTLMGQWRIPSPYRWRVPVLEGKEGILAVFGRWYGGRDRISLRCKSLAPEDAIVYSIVERKLV